VLLGLLLLPLGIKRRLHTQRLPHLRA